MSYDLYVKNDEIIDSLCVDKVGDMVTLRKDIHNELGVFHKGTVFHIEKIIVNSEMEIRKVLTSEINNYEADPRIFIYDLSIPETDIEIKNVNSDFFHEAHNKLDVFVLWSWAIAVIAVILMLLYNFLFSKGDDMNTSLGIGMTIALTICMTKRYGIFEKPNIYKKHTKKCYNSTKNKKV